MKKIKLATLLLVALFLVGCFEDNDDVIIPATTTEINDFVWKAMNAVYLYKSGVPNLADDRFSSNEEYSAYLNSYSVPEALFESLIFQRQTVDRFSIIVDDYIALEQSSAGIFTTNGMEFFLVAAPNSDTELAGIVRLVLRDSDAENKGVKRGDIFYGINGTTLTRSNVSNLLGQESYTINLGNYDDKGTPDTADDSISPNGTSIDLIKFQYVEDPIYVNDIFQVNGENVGYLMYNGFTGGSENGLNSVFANFKSNNVQHLVLDLRYNPGGFVTTATTLASLITGQFTGQIFEKLVFNENLQSNNRNFNFSDNFEGTGLNSLGLTKVYILTTSASASASEGVINGLKPYIEVIQIGTETTGKTQASQIFYDSGAVNDFRRNGANPSHRYAIRPLIANGVNKNNEAVPGTGIPPTIGLEYQESLLNLGVLGDINEPLLALALADIESSTTKKADIKNTNNIKFETITDSNSFLPFEEGGMLAD